MIDPRFLFQKRYGVNPDGIIRFYMIEGIKLQKGPYKYGLFVLTLNYARSAYGLSQLKYHNLWYLINRYKVYQQWLSKRESKV